MPLSRLERLRALMKDHIDALPDLVTKPESQPEPESGSCPALEQEEATEPDPAAQPEPVEEVREDWMNNSGVTLPSDQLEQQAEEQLRQDAYPPGINEHTAAYITQSSTTASHLPGPKLERGQLGPVDQAYSPILPLSKSPYKFLGESDKERVADKFFNAGKFWLREWDLYYVREPETDKVVVFISEHQLQHLFGEINKAFKHLGVGITPYFWEVGLIIKFPSHPHTRPRYLGRSTSREEYNAMEAKAPPASFRPPGEPASLPPEERTLEMFKQMIEDAILLNKNKNQASRAKKKEERIVKQQNMGKQLKRTQRYLGLRPKRENIPDPLQESTMSWAEQQAAIAERQAALYVPPIDPTAAAPYPFESSVVFICVDVEAWERNQRIITEIGVSTLDTLDLVGLLPGKDGSNWVPKIRNRHFRILEHRTYNNTEYISGCADRFEFGESEWISIKDAPAAIASCFKEPFSKSYTPEEAAATWAAAEVSASSSTTASVSAADAPKRNIIFLGHDTANDVNYLQILGYNPLNLSNLVEMLDTATLHRTYTRSPSPKSLGGILHEFDIAGWNLHNAGNDSRYTVQAMLAIAVRDAERRGEEAKKAVAVEREQKQQVRLQTAVQDAVRRVQEETEGWSSVDDGDDGGVPLADELEKLRLGEEVKGSAAGGKENREMKREEGGGLQMKLTTHIKSGKNGNGNGNKNGTKNGYGDGKMASNGLGIAR